MLSIPPGHSYFLRLDRKQLERAEPFRLPVTLQVAARLRTPGTQPTLFSPEKVSSRPCGG